MSQSNLEVTQRDGQWQLLGSLDRNTVARLALPINDYQGAVTLDLRQIERTDSAGLAWLIQLAGQLRQQNHPLVLINVPEQLQSLISLGKVASLFKL